MTEFQIKQTAELLLSDLEAKNMKPEDYRVMFNNAKTGLYGKQYDRLDGQVIFEWVRLYWEERLSVIVKINEVLHEKYKKESFDKSDINPEGQARVLKIFKEAADLDALPFVDAPVKPTYIVDERTAFIQECFTEFDKIYKTKGIPGVLRYIKYDVKDDFGVIVHKDKPVDQVEFTEIKLREKYNGIL